MQILKPTFRMRESYRGGLGSRPLQKLVMEGIRVPQPRRGESSNPKVMKATMAIPTLKISDRFRIRRAMIWQAIADFRQSLWNLEALAGLETSTQKGLGRPRKRSLQTTGRRLRAEAPTKASNAKKLKHPPAWTPG